MKKFYTVLLLCLALVSCVKSADASVKRDVGCMIDRALGAEIAEERQDTMYQISVYEAYKQGYYKSNDNKVTAAKNYGNFGFGLLKDEAGAILFLNDKHFKAKEFKGLPLLEKEYVPIAYGLFKYFDADDKITAKKTKNISELNARLDSKLITQNYFVALKGKGKFYSVVLELETGETQIVNDITGYIIGVRIPQFYSNVAPVGYTYYFISEDNLFAAKVKDIDVNVATFAIDYTNRMEIILPKQKSFKLRDFAQYEPKTKKQKDADKKISPFDSPQDRQKMMSTPKGEPTTEDMMQMFAPKATF